MKATIARLELLRSLLELEVTAVSDAFWAETLTPEDMVALGRVVGELGGFHQLLSYYSRGVKAGGEPGDRE